MPSKQNIVIWQYTPKLKTCLFTILWYKDMLLKVNTSSFEPFTHYFWISCHIGVLQFIVLFTVLLRWAIVR